MNTRNFNYLALANQLHSPGIGSFKGIFALVSVASSGWSSNAPLWRRKGCQSWALFLFATLLFS